MADLRRHAGQLGRSTKRVVVTVVGSTLIGVGIVLLVIPGPGILLIAAGLAVLATEYAWARQMLDWLKRRVRKLQGRPPDAASD